MSEEEYEVIAWKITSPEFTGIVYTQEVALDKLSESVGPVEVDKIFLYRDHKPLPHMTYRKVR